MIRLRRCECNYVRFSLDTARKYDNCHYNNCIVFQCFHTLARSVYGWHAQRALLMIASINWKSQRKMSQNEKEGTRRKSYSSKKVARRSPSCRTGDDGLVCRYETKSPSHDHPKLMTRVFLPGLRFSLQCQLIPSNSTDIGELK